MLEKLHAKFPSAQIDFLVRSGNEALLKDHPFIHECLVWYKKQHKYRNLFLLLRRIRKARYAKVINLQRFAASGILTAFSGAGETMGFSKNPLSFLFTRSFPHLIGTKGVPGKHEVERCHALIADFTDAQPGYPKLYPSASDQLQVASYLGTDFITISPASVWFTKQTPKNVWVELIRSISDKRIFLLGAPADMALCEEIILDAGSAFAVSLAGKLSLLQSAALMQHAVRNFTNDSAPLHLCSAMNAPVTAVFCSTIPEFGFGPLSQDAAVVQVKEDLACKPCGLHGYAACPLGHFRCSHIDINDLAETIR